jgi:ATP-dependent Zn protease
VRPDGIRTKQVGRFILHFVLLAPWVRFLTRMLGIFDGVRKMSYGDFKAAVLAGQVAEVHISPTLIRGRMVVATDAPPPATPDRLGGRMPKGILPVGVPFFSITGSEFVEIFVGVAPRASATSSSRRRRRPLHHLHRRAGRAGEGARHRADGAREARADDVTRR